MWFMGNVIIDKKERKELRDRDVIITQVICVNGVNRHFKTRTFGLCDSH